MLGTLLVGIGGLVGRHLPASMEQEAPENASVRGKRVAEQAQQAGEQGTDSAQQFVFKHAGRVGIIS